LIGLQRLHGYRSIENARLWRDTRIFSDKYLPVVLTKDEQEKEFFRQKQNERAEELRLLKERKMLFRLQSGKPIFARKCVVYGDGISKGTCGMQTQFYIQMVHTTHTSKHCVFSFVPCYLPTIILNRGSYFCLLFSNPKKDRYGKDVECTQEDIDFGFQIVISPPNHEKNSAIASYAVEFNDPEVDGI
jgi:hypothetical protein